MPSPPGLAARRAALVMLDAVMRRGQTIDAASARATSRLSDADRRLAIAIAGETVRRLPRLDAMIDSKTKKRLPDDSKGRMVLRLALAQKLAMDVPDHAIVATAIPLVDGGPRRLVHGVLGALLRDMPEEPDIPTLPPDVARRWQAQWGDGVVEAASRAILSRPALDLSFKEDDAARSFAAANGAMRLAPRHARLTHFGPVTTMAHYDTGEWWVQDLAASLPARLVPPDARRVLDIAAAPGGKTMQLASAGHDVTALDVSEQRLERLRENLVRTGLEATIVTHDALDWAPDEPFDAILLDAPCSATGTFRRHPEVLYRARPAIIEEMAALQSRLLDRAAQWLKPGGSLVYAVCSLEPEEGEAQVASFLERHSGFEIRAVGEPVEGVAASREGFLRILPGTLEREGGMDGFFIAHLVAAR